MDQNTLELFTRQLAHWAEAAIEQSRLPFRKVETFPSLLTEGGKQTPPLVFWINRDSFMAGGVLLVPERQAEDALEAGCQCARALGLKHFVTWSPNEIVFWEDRSPAAGRVKTISLPEADAASPVAFREALVRLLEELKLLSVLGALPPESLSPHYLANLFRGTLLSADPYLCEAYRIALGENRLEDETADAANLAATKGKLSLLRMLALLLFDRLPAAVQPEGLERAMHFALDTLPAGLRETLLPTQEELPLPVESAVRFHHLFRRLIQLRLGVNRQRAEQTLTLLLDQEMARFEGGSLPAPALPPLSPQLLVNPGHLPEAMAAAPMMIAPPALLGCIALLRSLRQQPPLQAQAASPLAFVPTSAPRSVLGTLDDENVPSVRQRQALTAQLRSSWPTRRFQLRPQTPRWAWEFIHLLGVAAPGALLQLRVPASWLSADFGEPLFRLLSEEFCFQRLTSNAEDQLLLQLVKEPATGEACQIEGPGGRRELPAERLAGGPRSLLLLALELSRELFSLLEQGLVTVPEASEWPEDLQAEAFLFSRSTLGRHLWRVVSGGAALPQRAYLQREALRLGWPLPGREVLASLRQLDWQEKEAPPSAELLDRQLAEWFGRDLQAQAAPASRQRKRPLTRPQETSGDDQAAEIAAQVFVDGLPKFPEHYLYDYFRPSMLEFRLPGPLEAGEEFFGRCTLRTKTGAELEVEGAETARALVICSHGKCPAKVSLPADRAVMTEILERYLSDLRQLRLALVRQVHKGIANPRAAEAMIERIWNSQALPPWRLVEE